MRSSPTGNNMLSVLSNRAGIKVWAGDSCRLPYAIAPKPPTRRPVAPRETTLGHISSLRPLKQKLAAAKPSTTRARCIRNGERSCRTDADLKMGKHWVG